MAKPAPFPHRYTVVLENRQMLAPPRAPIAAGPPPQFGGSDQVWSPEEMLVGAVLECLWTTALAYARREALEIEAWRGLGTGVLDRGPDGPVFTSIRLNVELQIAPADEERARRVIAAAERDCIISRALRAPVIVEVAFAPGHAQVA